MCCSFQGEFYLIFSKDLFWVEAQSELLWHASSQLIETSKIRRISKVFTANEQATNLMKVIKDLLILHEAPTSPNSLREGGKSIDWRGRELGRECLMNHFFLLRLASICWNLSSDLFDLFLIPTKWIQGRFCFGELFVSLLHRSAWWSENSQ